MASVCALLSGCRMFGVSDDEAFVITETVTSGSAYTCSLRDLCIIDKPSPNFDRRTLPINIIVLHYTGAPFRESLNTLTNGHGKHRVSSHYLIDKDGLVYRLVDESKRAWHAGVSRWRGITDVNSASIGIEIVNKGQRADGTFEPFTPEQIEAATELCLDLQSRYDIQSVVGHSDIAPQRKIDPGPCFPWTWLSTRGVKVCR